MDDFEILSKLGDGTYSIVYKVKRKADNKIYALKKVNLQKLSQKERENSLNEVRILASIKSNFVISYKEAFIEEQDKSLCIVMEYADRGDLYQKIVQFKRKGCLIEEADIWKIFIQMTKGLKALHDLKILHRDLKSANIFLFSDGSAKIGDLNVSKVVRMGMGLTQTGTPYYASPEVWDNKPYDSKSDIWGLGCVTYEMITLHPPFRAQNMEGLYNKIIKGQYPKISDKYSSDLAQVIDLLLKVRPEDRPSCQCILKHTLILKRIEYFQAQAGIEFEDLEDVDENQLLKTIRLPKNLLGLGDKLPKANYNPIKPTKKLTIEVKNKNEVQDNKEPNFNSIEALPSITHNKRFNSQSEKIQSKKIIKLNKGKDEENENKNDEENKNQIILSQRNNNLKNVKVDSPSKNIIKKDNVNDSHKNNRNNKLTNSNKNQKDLKSFFQGIGLGEIYRIYAPQLEGYNKIYKRKYNNNYVNKSSTKKALPNIHIVNNQNGKKKNIKK